MSVRAAIRLLVGDTLPTTRAVHQRLPKVLALPVFASDAISSSAYATEEILLALVVAGAAGLHVSTGVAIAIALLFATVALSYRQTVLAYPTGGGAYIVARENLGLYPGLVAAAALLTDYVLTVAVSIAAGVAAIISALPALASYRVDLCVACIAFVTIVNLRGAKEAGKLFAGPVYLFVGSVLVMLGVGAVRILFREAPAETAVAQGLATLQPVTVFLVLRAFASGCAALTGIEAISNGVPAFRPPESRNAATTLLWMAAICIVLFVGVTALAQAVPVVPDVAGGETVLSKLGRHVLGQGVLYYLLQAATALILVLAANTSFADFPRLASILARDGVVPRQLANLGDRLVFANGIILLGLFSAALVVVFGGLAHSLIPLYAVGVFVSFTLSQAGMVVHWHRLKSGRWQYAAGLNTLGALTTGVVLVVVAVAKFRHGAWIVLLIIPLVIMGFRKIAQHYEKLKAALSLEGYRPPRTLRHAVLVLVPGLHRGVLQAIQYAKTIAPEVEAIYVEIDPAETAKLQQKWADCKPEAPLTVLKSPWRSLVGPIVDYVKTVRAERNLQLVTVILPEFATRRWWHVLLHNQAGLLLKLALMLIPSVVVTNVRYQVED